MAAADASVGSGDRRMTDEQWCASLVAMLNAKHVTFHGYKATHAMMLAHNVGVAFRLGHKKVARGFPRRQTIAEQLGVIEEMLAREEAAQQVKH